MAAAERILLVEDDPRLSELTSRQLRRHGYDVDVAFTGADAIALAQTGRHSGGHPMELTAQRSVPPGRTCEVAIFEGANHYSLCEGYDGTSGRGYLEAPATGDQAAVREQIAMRILAFVTSCLGLPDGAP